MASTTPHPNLSPALPPARVNHHGDHHGDDNGDHHAHHRGTRRAAAQGKHRGHQAPARLVRTAFWATLHCLAGCAVGEVLGLVIGTALGWGNLATTVLAVALAFGFGYAFTVVPLRRRGLAWREAARLALAADTASIAVMEITDNAVMWLVPGAMDATLAMPLFWAAMAAALTVALFAAWPLNLWLLSRGRGHALVHAHHGHG